MIQDDSQHRHAVDEEEQACEDAEAREAHTLSALRQLLIDTQVDDLSAVQSLFKELAYCRETVASAAQRLPPVAQLSGLAERLHGFLEQFDRHVRGGIIDLKIAGPTAAAAICSGLGMLPDMLDAGLLSKEAGKELGKTVVRLTRALINAVVAAPGDADRQRTEDMQLMLIWLSRGLKARLLASDDRPIRDAFSHALELMPQWAAAPGSSGLDGYRLATCFVLINTIRQFGLLHLDGNGSNARANRQRLQAVLRSLCVALPDIVANTAAVNGVQTANVGNTIKDFADAGLLPQQTHGWLMPVVAILLQRMPRVPQREMMHKGGQVLANCSNFLRMLSESGLQQENAFTVCSSAYQTSCAHLIGMMNRESFVLKGRVGQSLANLMSFVKAMARQEERHKPAGAQQAAEADARQARLNVAAQRLMRLLGAEDLQRLSPRSISGLLSALSYIWGRGMAPAGMCRTLTQGLIAAIPPSAGRQWESATVALSLRAIVQLHDLHQDAQVHMQPAFLRLLQLLAKKPLEDEVQRLYCLQALRLGLQQKWTTPEQAALQAALRSLLRWDGKHSPGMAQLEAAIASLRHREESAPARLEVVEAEAAGPAPLQAGTAAWAPPGGKPAVAGSAPAFRQDDGAGKPSTTYRAPVAQTTAARTVATSTAPAARASRFGHAGNAAVLRGADPVTQWFTLASGAERGAALIDMMAHLASSGAHPGIVNCTDEYGDNALYYAVVNGKPELAQWLMRHPAFSLGMAAEATREFVERLESDILSSANWREAKQALASVVELVRPRSDAEQEDDGSSKGTSGASSQSSNSSPIASGKKAKPGKARSAHARSSAGTQSGAFETDAGKRREEWFRLARGKSGGKDVRRQMRRLDEIDPDLFHSYDEFGENALHYAKARGKQKMEAWLWELTMRRLGNMSVEYAREYDLSGGLSGLIDQSLNHSDFVNWPVYKENLLASVNARLAEARAGDPSRSMTDAERIAQAFRQDDVAVVRRLLRTEAGKTWARTHLNKEGHNQLMIAAYQGSIRMVEALLEVDQGSLAEQGSAFGFTALLIAAGAGHLDVVKALLRFDHGKLALHATPGGRNALMLAAERGQNHCVKYLLAWNGGKLAPLLSNKHENALIIAASAGHPDVVRTLLAYKAVDLAAQLRKDRGNAMTVAAEAGHAQVVKLLLGWNDGCLAMLGRGDYTPLLLAAREGHVDVLKVLLESKDGPVLARCQLMDGRNALALAQDHGHVEASNLLREFDGGSLIGRTGHATPEVDADGELR